MRREKTPIIDSTEEQYRWGFLVNKFSVLKFLGEGRTDLGVRSTRSYIFSQWNDIIPIIQLGLALHCLGKKYFISLFRFTWSSILPEWIWVANIKNKSIKKKQSTHEICFLLHTFEKLEETMCTYNLSACLFLLE